MVKKFRLSDELSVPQDLVTQRISVLGRTGSGKTFTVGVIAEEVIKNHFSTVIIDPKGDFWGLRASADGKGPGLKITILGGEHGDAPLDSAAGVVVADMVVSEGVSLILDLSLFNSKAEEQRFVTAFLDRLYRKNRRPVLLIVDEADEFAPQSPMPDDRLMVSKMELVARRGRKRGIGIAICTQRSAAIHKGVLSQTEVMIAHQTTSPHDKKAIWEWVKGKGTKEQEDAFLDRLPQLTRGRALVWSPSWLGVYKEVHIRMKETFDSSATPSVRARRSPPKILASVDIEQLKKHMASAIEKAKQDDPKELRQQIVQLKQQLTVEQHRAKIAQAQSAAAPAKKAVTSIDGKTTFKKVEVPIITRGQATMLETLAKRLENHQAKMMERLPKAIQDLTDSIAVRASMIKAWHASLDWITKTIKAAPFSRDGEGQAVESVADRVKFRTPAGSAAAAPIVMPPRAKPDVVAVPEEGGEKKISKSAEKILLMVASYTAWSYNVTKRQGISRSNLAALCGFSNSGTFSTYLSQLNCWKPGETGLIFEGETGLILSDQGREYLISRDKTVPPFPKPDTFRSLWLGILNVGARKIFQELFDLYPGEMTTIDLAQRTGYAKSGTFSTYLSAVRARGLLDDSRKKILRINPIFFEGL